MNKWLFYKTSKTDSVCASQDAIKKVEKQPSQWDNIFTDCISNKGFLSRIYKDLYNTIIKRQVIQLKAGKDLDFSKEDIQMFNKHMKSCSTSLVIREIQNKTKLGFLFKDDCNRKDK